MLCAIRNACVCTVELFGLLVSIPQHCSITSSLPNKCFSVCFSTASCQEGKKQQEAVWKFKPWKSKPLAQTETSAKRHNDSPSRQQTRSAVEACCTYVWDVTLMVFYPTARCAITNNALFRGVAT